MISYFISLLSVIVPATSNVHQQLNFPIEKHQGKVYSILGEYEGVIYINLNRENKEMIEIEIENTTIKSGGKTQKSQSSVKLNVGTINRLVIDSVEYKIRSIQYGDQKFYQNCCLRLVSSNKKVALYGWGSKTEANTYSLWQYGESYPKILKEISELETYFLFQKCKQFKVKMEDKQAGYYLDEKSSDEDRLTTWKRWIDETKDCLTP